MVKVHPSWEIKNLKRRVSIARWFPHNTCPSSRHLQIMGECLMKKGGYPMLQEEPEHCARFILAVVSALYEARTELASLRKEPWYDEMRKAKAKKRARGRRSAEK